MCVRGKLFEKQEEISREVLVIWNTPLSSVTSDGTVWGIVLFWCKSKDLWFSLWPFDYKWCNSDVVRSARAGSENVSLMPQLCSQGRWKPQVSGCRHVKEEGRLWEQQVCQSPCQGSEKLHSRNCMWACQALLHGATSAFTRLPVLWLKLQVREIFYLSLCWTWKGPVACRVPHDAQHWPISRVFTTSWISSFKTVSVVSLLSWTEGSPDCHFMWIHGSDFGMQESSFFLVTQFCNFSKMWRITLSYPKCLFEYSWCKCFCWHVRANVPCC